MVNIYGISKFHVKLFTDAVFGVAITLLAVELQAPNIENSGIFDISQFEELFTIFVSYITAFVIIGMYWITYHSVFRPLRRTTDLMIWLNLSFLLLIALIPFSVRLIDKYENQYSFIIYSLIQILTGMMLFLIWQHAIKSDSYRAKAMMVVTQQISS
jgi:TMEM175 potassium channel family protein